MCAVFHYTIVTFVAASSYVDCVMVNRYSDDVWEKYNKMQIIFLFISPFYILSHRVFISYIDKAKQGNRTKKSATE